MAIQILDARFVTTAVKPPDWPPAPLPELAFVGRSNVGKSSMLNTLCQRRGLARVSNTPGRTRALQFFELRLRRSPAAASEVVRFADLPGYGYAKVSKAERAGWAGMIEGYLKKRERLDAVVAIVDARHPPSAEDREVLGFLASCGRPVVLAATKIDKLPKAKRRPAVQALERELGVEAGSAIVFSSVDGTGYEELWARLLDLAALNAA